MPLGQRGKGEKRLSKKKKKKKVEKKIFFSKKNSWVVAPIFDGPDVGIQKISKKNFFFCILVETLRKPKI